MTFRHVLAQQVPSAATKENGVEPEAPRRRIMSPQVPLGRHPEPEFREVTFLPHQADPTDGACTTAVSMVRNRRQLALVQGIYGLDKHRREQLVGSLDQPILRLENRRQLCFHVRNSTLNGAEVQPRLCASL